MSVVGVCGLVALTAFLVLVYLLWRLAGDSYEREQRKIARQQLRERDPIDPENIND